MSKFSKFRKIIRTGVLVLAILAVVAIAGTRMMVGHFTLEMWAGLALAVLITLMLLRNARPRMVIAPWDTLQPQPIKPHSVMNYKGRPFNFVKFDPVKDDPSDDAWVGSLAS